MIFTIEINGQTVTARRGETILSILNRTGIRVPTLCHLAGFTPTGACRHVRGRSRRHAGSGHFLLTPGRRMDEDPYTFPARHESQENSGRTAPCEPPAMTAFTAIVQVIVNFMTLLPGLM